VANESGRIHIGAARGRNMQSGTQIVEAAQ
jgi:hypothetical protein